MTHEEGPRTCGQCGAPVDQGDGGAAGFGRLFAVQQQARDLGRHVITGGDGLPGGYYGAVAATYPEGSRVARRDSWRCHHDHPDAVAALECALGEVRRLAAGGPYEPCSAGPECRDEWCRPDWAERPPADPERRAADELAALTEELGLYGTDAEAAGVAIANEAFALTEETTPDGEP